MNSKISAIVLSIIMLLVFTPPALAQGPLTGGRFVIGENFTLESGQKIENDLVVLGGNVSIKPESSIHGNLAVFGGNVTVDGTINGDVAAMGGNITVNGSTNGDIVSFGGNITVSKTAVVKGDIVTLGGVSSVAEGATVTGRIKTGDQPEEKSNEIVPPVAPNPPASPSDNSISFATDDGWDSPLTFLKELISEIVGTITLLLTMVLIAWLVAAFMPEQVLTIRATLSEAAAASFGVGLITMLVSVVAGIVLLVTICLAFVPIIAWIFLAIAGLLGWLVVSQIFGERLLLATGRPDPGLIRSSVVGVLVLTLLTKMPVIGSIPCIGWAVGFVAAVIGLLLWVAGLGAVLLTRFGFRPYPAPAAAPVYAAPSPRPSVSTGPRVRWAGPEPVVSGSEPLASEQELNARIKAALAEADEPKDDDPDKDNDAPAKDDI